MMDDKDSIGCMRQKCYGVALYRGLCMRHYRQLQNRVRHDCVSWKYLEAKGLCKEQIRGKDGKLNKNA